MKKTKSTQKTLAGNNQSFLYQHCGPEWYPLIELYKKTFEFQKGEKIFKEGQQVNGMYVIDTGKVKVIASYGKGKEQLLRLATDGEILGHRGLGGNHKYPVSATALTHTTVTFIPDEIFNKLLKANNGLCFYLMNFFAEELHHSEANSREMYNTSVKKRIARAILLNYEKFGIERSSKQLTYTLSRKDIANLSGTTYESVVRTLSEFNKKGIINLDGKSIGIPDKQALENIK
ncbi:MAG: Crp/Fnr family transcriptional regulator [Flavobacteriales bacterium]|nr:Crp/Fnr family transcriptional regulator [Flavobacteriales bacterium]MCB9447014.1 Crp/Fnr family transcriptional regulator [Flavobacteriales bacterium]